MEEEADPTERVEGLADLAQFFVLRYNMSGMVKRLNIAVALLQFCVQQLPFSHPATISAGNTFVKTLLDRVYATSRIEDIDHALLLLRQIIQLAPPSNCAICTLNLARALRYQAFYCSSDILYGMEEPISLLRRGLDMDCLSSVLRYEYTLELAHSVRMQSFFSPTPAKIISHAIELFTQSMEMGYDAPILARSGLLTSFGRTLMDQYDHFSRLEDLDRAISYFYKATDILHSFTSSPTRISIISGLAIGLSHRANYLGTREDLDKSIAIHREIIKHQRDFADTLKASAVQNLGCNLEMRFQVANRAEDLDEAIDLNHKALFAQNGSYFQTANLNNRANLLSYRFKKSGDGRDLDEAICLAREALTIAKGTFITAGIHNTLGNSLLARSELCGSICELEEAIFLLQQAAKCVTGLYIPLGATDLANAWRLRYQRSLDPADFIEAHSALQNALDHLHPNHPFRCIVQHKFGELFTLRFFVSGEQCYLARAVTSFRSSTTCAFASIWDLFQAASIWAQNVDSFHASALEAYETAIGFLPRLVNLSLNMRFRQDALKSGTDGLARNAAECAVRQGDTEKAVELLEQGRGVFWAQLLQLRTPLDALKEVAPDAQVKFSNVSWALEHGAKKPGPSDDDKIAIEKEEKRLRNLNDEWLATVDQIRKISGFEQFLRPLRFIFIQEAARLGPIVILNVAALAVAINALIVTEIGVWKVSLPQMNTKIAEGLVEKVHAAAALSGGRENSHLYKETRRKIQNDIGTDFLDSHPGPFDREFVRAGRVADTASDPDFMFQDVLSALWDNIVEPILSSLNMLKESPEGIPRIYWCPTGPLAFLPIHAAGHYDDNGSHSVSDYCISSYTPTIGTLRRRDNDVVSVPFRMMVVVQPNELPQTKMELENIQLRIPAPSLITLGTPGSLASVDTILTHLPNVTVAHFACHGVQEPGNPLESALLVDGGRLKISQILQQPLPNASFAFLCACQTAKGSMELPDEAIHLSASLLFAGFQSVVGTMWSIADQDGPKIADTFYEYLTIQSDKKLHDVNDDAPIDTSRSAEALHYAVKELRASGASFTRWVPYIHMGR